MDKKEMDNSDGEKGTKIILAEIIPCQDAAAADSDIHEGSNSGVESVVKVEDQITATTDVEAVVKAKDEKDAEQKDDDQKVGEKGEKEESVHGDDEQPPVVVPAVPAVNPRKRVNPEVPLDEAELLLTLASVAPQTPRGLWSPRPPPPAVSVAAASPVLALPTSSPPAVTALPAAAASPVVMAFGSVPAVGVNENPTPQRHIRGRKNKHLREPHVPPPFPWATNERARIHSLDTLLVRGQKTITGNVACKRCKYPYVLEFDLTSRFADLRSYLVLNKAALRDRAPQVWMTPIVPICRECKTPSALRPIIQKKRSINWLFLLLGQMIGFCSISHLKYFCKHNGIHRTAAKDRLVYLTYLGILRMLDPMDPAFRYP